ncbi:L-threonylcarbamoyladenylate synthase [Halalkalicoccus sp. NIPERK01]|uniref:L-threonylcarbamoyladenylate synthase n=1 Tax=Halalkalicoccus sp. NIPERK01 TaxID=3053469 RepID=UPI00256EC5A8|nr:L-threonylcarbamoyladenylate synthase [Halalkalicoccus sp. NIPERK01]MDL5362983.1 L-threonylcarbamoyladenylate synthase [Halalkalicoccus sp. NIPERK01]
MELDRAARAIREGDLVVYPTETVYGLGADALDSGAVERVYEAKTRARSNPLSMAVPDVETAARHTYLTDRERAFVREFLPGPVTVIVEAGPEIPKELTAGRDRVGIRIPDHDLALSLLEDVAPITATSANVSGNPSVRRVDDLDPAIRGAVACVLDGGETGGTESTVVDVERGEVHRRGALADEIEAWLEAE